MDDFKFWVAVGEVEQLDFEGRKHLIPQLVGNVHIVKSDVLMCKRSRDALKRSLKAKKQKTVENRPRNVPLCPECEENWKKDLSSAWNKWVTASAIEGGKTPVMNNVQTLL